MTDRIADIWGSRTPYAAGTDWPARTDQYLADGVSEADVTWVQSACVLCSMDCGMDVAVQDGHIVGVRGRTADRVNHGRLGPKGLFGWQANASADRLTEPLVRRNGRLEPAADLRELYLAAQHAELAWVVLLQAAKAKRDAELIEVVIRCHEEAEMCGKWLRTRIKEAAPQVYAAG